MRYECYLTLVYLNYKTLLLNINFKGVFRTQSNIYGATFLLRKAPSQMFKWVLNTPLNFDLFYLFLVNSWEWLPCSAPWENIFFLIFIAIQASSRFLVWRQISNWVKKQTQSKNSAKFEIPRKSAPRLSLDFGLGLGLVLGLGQFSLLAICENLWNIGENGLKFIIV